MKDCGSYKGYTLLVDEDNLKGTLVTFHGEAKCQDGNFVDTISVVAGSEEEAVDKLKQQVDHRMADQK